MKRIFALIFIMCCILLTACSDAKSIAIIGGADGPTAIIVAEDNSFGLSLSAENVTNKGMTIKIEQSGANNAGELQTGAAYKIETFADDVWQDVKAKIENPVWNSIAYIIKKNGVTELEINWEFLYGSLPSGSYRLKKDIMNFKTAGDYEEKTYDVYFTIK